MTISRLYPLTLDAKFGEKRVDFLIEKIKEIPPNSLILSGELAFCGYRDFGTDFYARAMEKIAPNLENKLLAYTQKNANFNEFIIFNEHEILHSQCKTKLFKPNLEDKNFMSKSEKEIIKFKICGVKFGVLICFELRFLQLWERLCGAQIILVPAMWGAQKKAQFFTLLRALALQTRAYVVAVSDGGKTQLKMAKVFYPDGKSAKWAKFNLARIDEFRQNLGINLDEFNQNCSENLSSNLIQITSNLNKLEQIL